MPELIMDYFRPGSLPHMWCPGCGTGIVLQSFLRTVQRMGLSRDEVVVVGGIGCSARAVSYIDFNTVHTTHGRALAFATGIKLARPDLLVFVLMGDGDASAIGGNHLIHAARRNMDLNVLVINNSVYGMTGGQCSPLTPAGSKTATSPYGSMERQLNLTGLAEAAGATFVARSTAYHSRLTSDLIEQGIANKGFSFIEVISQCPTGFGRKNKMADPAAMLQWQKQSALPAEKFIDLPPGDAKGKFPIGVLYKNQAPDFMEMYLGMSSRAGCDNDNRGKGNE
ncbi:2-oxoglutarate oxidoreductase, beta subunit [Desulfocucumis palustris]|uniref:2-oxoglutarate oxidoreductase, beta subunit n=1 Tax=Desulfocucumis palustris TaxID=1898651 RepID=A0A2L2XAF5_9FIRM|nr:thiamine pyrophosphate-dependent enzyme [Desulfocucumis palustris]GBF32623.1 2-oxoglutarate oxidoreductase, beta subunit [Desulfocucumis palustris]